MKDGNEKERHMNQNTLFLKQGQIFFNFQGNTLQLDKASIDNK